MANKVQFKHFYGKKATWNNNLESEKWISSIVFGKIWNDESKKWEYKICAGKDDTHDKYYVYEIASLAEIKELEEKIKNISTLVDIDDESGSFTSSKFRDALENYIADSQTIANINDAITDINDAISNLDVSVNDITNYVHEHIEWIEKFEENDHDWVIE